ncbi:MAG: serine/threonine-protein kinase [Gemmatimonadales bacterium]
MTDPLARLAAALSDRYRIERELGQGGMATVYLAEDLKHDRKVAIKVLREDLSASLGKERFLREIKVAAGLQHPHVLPLYDSGEADGLLFYVMPFVDGLSLRERLVKEGELPIDEAVRILRDIADALSEAHKHGIVHRDLKPENVMLRGRHALVTDFGVAKALSEATGRQSITTVGIALGTPTYMAPEQAVADPMVDHRADIYAFGVVAYELLAGTPPFTGMNPQQVLAAHVTAAAEPIGTHRTVPTALSTLVMRCLEKKPADRWQSAEALIPQLESVLTPSGGMTPTATQPVRVEGRASPTRRVRIGVVITAVAAMAAFALWNRKPAVDASLNPDLIAVFPFRVTSADGSLDYLGDGMVDLLAAMYTGEGGPRAIDPRTALAAWKRHGGGEQAEAAGPAAARDLGAGQFLLGSVVGTGSRLVLSASVGRPGQDGAVVQARVEGPTDSLSSLLDVLVGQLLVRTAGLTSERAVGLSPSLEATRAYVAGRAANRRGDWSGAAVHFQRAIALDSSFTLAALGLSESLAWSPTGELMNARVQELAWSNRAVLSPRDQAVLAGYTGGNGPAPDSKADVLKAWESAVSRFPDLADAWYWLGETYVHSGQMLGIADYQARARQALEMASSLDPDMAAPLFHQVEMAVDRHDTAGAQRLLGRIIAQDSTSDARGILEFTVAEGVGDSAAVAAALARFARTGNPSVRWASLDLVDNGRGLGLIDTLFSLADRAATADASRRVAAETRTRVLMALGRPAEAVALARQRGVWDDPTAIMAVLYESAPPGAAVSTLERLTALALAPPADTPPARRTQNQAACLMAQWRLLREPGASVATFTDRLRQGSVRLDEHGAPEASPVCLAIVEALSAVRSGNPQAAALVIRLDSLLMLGPAGTELTTDGGDTSLQAADLLVARALEHVGMIEQASRAAWRGEGSSIWWAGLRDQGRLAALAGDREEAIRVYRRYLSIRSNPEPALMPQRDSVKAELAALVGEQ